MNNKNCPSCGAPVAWEATECKYCGEQIAVQPPPPPPPNQLYGNQPFQGQPQAPQYQTPPFNQQQPYGQPQYGQPYGQPFYRNPKSKVAAGLLGIFLGSFGIHKFYLGKIGWGIVYLLFCWTYIPAIVGFIEGIVYLASNEERFHMKYSK